MLRRVFIASALLIAVAAAPAVSQQWGIGPLFRGNVGGGGFGQSVGVSIQSTELPATLGIDLHLDPLQAGVTADWIMVREPLVEALSFYVGPGLYVALPQSINAGARLALGIDAWLTDWLEVFLEVPPVLRVIRNAEVDIGFATHPALGIRFWF